MFCAVKGNEEIKEVVKYQDRIVYRDKEVPERTYSGSKSISNMGGYTPLAVKLVVRVNRGRAGNEIKRVYANYGGSRKEIAALVYDGYSSGSARLEAVVDLRYHFSSDYDLRRITSFDGADEATIVRWK